MKREPPVVIIDGITICPEDCRPSPETMAALAPFLAEVGRDMATADLSTFGTLDELRAKIMAAAK